jgi:CBS-domain-containing membrane protein
VEFFTKTKAKDVMTRDVICVQPTTSVLQLSQLFIENNISGAPVTDDMQKTVGFVSQTDIVEFDLLLQSDNSLESRMEETGGFVQDIMSPVESVAHEMDSLMTIIDRMCMERMHRLIVLDDHEKVAGIITTMDVMCYLQRIYKSDE